MVNFPIFLENRTKCPEFLEYSADKMLELCIFLGKSRIFRVFISIDSVFSLLLSEYPNFLESSPPNTDCNPKIIRFDQFLEFLTTIHIKNRTYENGFSTNDK